jgi:hypothetical protein
MNSEYYGYENYVLDQAEIERLLDLLPASMRESVKILPASERQTVVIKGRRQMPWERQMRLFIKPYEWRQFTPLQRAGLFLHKVGYYSRAVSRQIDFYLAIAALGGVELDLRGRTTGSRGSNRFGWFEWLGPLAVAPRPNQ